MARRNGLGRGLGALIPTEVTQATSALREIPLSEIGANPFQPRKEFAEEALSALVDSIRAVGVLQPVLVRPATEGGYELIAGERRCRAARRAGLQVIPALVHEVADVTSLEQALVENIQREQLNALDEAAAYQQLIEDFSLTHEDVARRVGRSRVAVTNALRLLQLPPSVLRLLREERLSAGHARALLGTPDRDVQEALGRRAASEGLSVRAVEALVRELSAPPDARVELPPTAEEIAAEPAAWWPGRELDGGDDQSQDDGPVGGGWDEAVRTDVSRLAPAGADRRPEDGLGAEVAGISEGDGLGGAPGVRPPALRPPGFLELEELLADHLDTRVRVEMSARHGRVIIDFATLEDLERIYRVMVEGRPG